MKLPWTYTAFDGEQLTLTEEHVAYARKLAYDAGVETGTLLTVDIRPWTLYFAVTNMPGVAVEVLADWFPGGTPDGTPEEEQDCVLGFLSESALPAPVE